jgi:phage shock protein A
MGKITPLFGGKEDEPTPAGAEPVLTGLIGDMTAHLIAAKNRIADSRKEERRLAQQAEIAARAAGDWEQRAMSAVRAGDDVVAKDALLRKRQHELEYERFRATEKDQHQQTASLTRTLVTLNFRIEEAKQKRDAVVARAERADVRPALEEDTRALEGRDADDVSKQLEAKMTDIETELELSDEAMANLTREAGDALRTRGELARQKRDTAIAASKPLAKTVPDAAESARSAASQVVGVSGPQRTKR